MVIVQGGGGPPIIKRGATLIAFDTGRGVPQEGPEGGLASICSHDINKVERDLKGKDNLLSDFLADNLQARNPQTAQSRYAT